MTLSSIDSSFLCTDDSSYNVPYMYHSLAPPVHPRVSSEDDVTVTLAFRKLHRMHVYKYMGSLMPLHHYIYATKQKGYENAIPKHMK